MTLNIPPTLDGSTHGLGPELPNSPTVSLVYRTAQTFDLDRAKDGRDGGDIPVTAQLEPVRLGGEEQEGARLPERYTDLGRIASGSFGEVRRVRDHLLDRVLAIKILRLEHVDDERVKARFLTEAAITAQLQHPGIVPVHDRGMFSDGRPWFTMKEVHGQTLESVIHEIYAAAGPNGFRQRSSGWTFRRAVDAFARIAQAVGYAHEQGVVHRDLKPANMMVSDHGEALVMDWGLARWINRAPEGNEPIADVIEAIHGDSSVTRHGDVLGTPAYMPPEQARGISRLHGPESDVYALGAILYHLLTGRAPFGGSGVALFRQILASTPQPIVEVLAGRSVPKELIAISERAMQRDIAARYPNASVMASELVAWLDGARRREQALAALAAVRPLEPVIAELRARADTLEVEARTVLATVRPFDPIEKKRPAWAREDEALALNRRAALHETEWLQGVHGALTIDPELPEAHEALADHYKEQLTLAEIARNDEDATRFEALLRAHDRGKHATFLRGEGALTLVTDPEGALVELHRFVARDRRLVPELVRELGRTPLREVSLPHGSYLLVVRAEGRAEVRYPVLVERGGVWDGVPPGDKGPYPIVLPKVGDLGPDDVYVPAGPTWIGGDPFATDSFARQRVWVDGFVIRRFPVTSREYLEFLNDLVEQGREDEALAACPRLPMDVGDSSQSAFGRDRDGRFVIAGDDVDSRWLPEWPVTLIDWFGALAFARWAGSKSLLQWRLVSGIEREKAARGVDGRFFPWGNSYDPSFACTSEGQQGRATRAEIGHYGLDESVYGVRGLSGNVRDWCIDVWRRDGHIAEAGRALLRAAAEGDESFRMVRGGTWNSPTSFARAAGRFGNRPADRRITMGFRLAASYPAT